MTIDKNKYRYPGSQPFSREDEAIFFGREMDIEELSKYILVEKLVVLYGRSGLGKTSLLQAGVFPKLTIKENYHIYPIRFKSYNQELKEYPCEIVSNHLHYHTRENSFLNKIIEPNEASLWQICKHLEWENGVGSKHILVFDQVEELFTHPDGIDDFALQLSDILRRRMPRKFKRKLRWRLRHEPDLLTEDELLFLDSSPDIKIVFSVRSDKLNLLDKLADTIPNILENLYELEALSRSQAKRAIIEPALKQDENFLSPPFNYEEAALDIFLDFLTQNNSKPIESFQLQVLLQYIEENIVIKASDTFIETSDVGDLQDIYQNYYNTQIQKLNSKDAIQKARKLIEENLIFEEEQRRLSLFEGQILKQHDLSLELLQQLVNTHLLRAESSGSDSVMYEISHDSLVEPILKSKAQRLENEKIEAERRETAEMRLRIRKQKNRFRRNLIGLGIFSFVVVIIVGNFYWDKKVAYDELEVQQNELMQSEQTLKEQKEELERKTQELENARKRYENLYDVAIENEKQTEEARKELERILTEKEELLAKIKRMEELGDKKDRLKNAIKQKTRGF